MALFNKLFSSRKNCSKTTEVQCEKTFILTKDQIRIVLFRECDYRGRKLLFDSKSIEKIPLACTGAQQANNSSSTSINHEKYVEISNGFKYQYAKPCPDVSQLGEMIFGSVAMSYRGTSLKIHSLASPLRLMCSQTFPSPNHSSKPSSSAPSHYYMRSSANSSQSLEQSLRLDDSYTSSAYSTSDHLSVYSTGSDTLLVSKGSRSVPLDVPIGSSNVSSVGASSVVGDSGFGGERSYSSVTSGPQSLPLSYTLHEDKSFSCGSLYKRWLRSASTSLEHSTNSLTGSASADECLLKLHSRTNKLGLAVIIELPLGHEKTVEQFLMEHAALIESMMWRARQGAEVAYMRHTTFVSVMSEVASHAALWLIDLLSGPQLATHLWISLAPVCDKLNSINFSTRNSKCTSDRSPNATETFFSSASLSNSLSDGSGDSTETLDRSSDFTLLNLTRFLRSEWAAVSAKSSYSCREKNDTAEKCITELCELLECIDVKHTNFFVSTLVTAVLTHHLGWVASILPPSSYDKEKVSKLHNPCNPLWGQLTDLYGAIGHPTKVAHTIITGTNKPELITKILNSLTYFIRCSDIERKCVTRLDIKEENKTVDFICKQKSCIPKQNYKKYEDHLREIEEASEFYKFCINKTEIKLENIELQNLACKTFKPKGLLRTNTCVTDLSTMNRSSQDINKTKLYPNLKQLKDETIDGDNYKHDTLLNKVKSLGLTVQDDKFELTNEEITEKVKKLCRVPASAVLYHTEQDRLVNIGDVKEKIFKVFAPKKINLEKQQTFNYLSSSNARIDEEKQCFTERETPLICEARSGKHDVVQRSTLIKMHSKGQTEPILSASTEVDCNIIKQNGDADIKVTFLKCNRRSSKPTFAKSNNWTSFNEKVLESDCGDSNINLYATGSHGISNVALKSSSVKELKKCKKSDHLYSMSKTNHNTVIDNCDEEIKKNVIFVLGDNEELVGLKKAEPCSSNSLDDFKNNNDSEVNCLNAVGSSSDTLSSGSEASLLFKSGKTRPSSLNLENSCSCNLEIDFLKNSEFKDCEFVECTECDAKPSTSWTSSNLDKNKSVNPAKIVDAEKNQSRSQSVPPEDKKVESPATQTRSKYRYSGVKFNFQQHPQIVANYMRSKNLELSQLHLAEKAMKLSEEYPTFNFLSCDTQGEEVETLQTPSNASELEFTSDLITDSYEVQHAKENVEKKTKTFVRNQLPNTVVNEPESSELCEHPLQSETKNMTSSCSTEKDNYKQPQLQADKMQIVELPMPRSQPVVFESVSTTYTSTLMRGIGDRYISDMVLQGTSAPKSDWETTLRRDLSLATHHPLLDQPIDEAVAIVANTDTWEVQLLSSHTYVVDKGLSGVRVGMSQLVANMLESLLDMWKLHTPPEYCILHIEQRLQEFCTLSKALAELLLATEFCSMDLLTSVLQLEVNDVPLIMAVASTHSPQVTQKYGLSFQ